MHDEWFDIFHNSFWFKNVRQLEETGQKINSLNDIVSHVLSGCMQQNAIDSPTTLLQKCREHFKINGTAATTTIGYIIWDAITIIKINWRSA